MTCITFVFRVFKKKLMVKNENSLRNRNLQHSKQIKRNGKILFSNFDEIKKYPV